MPENLTVKIIKSNRRTIVMHLLPDRTLVVRAPLLTPKFFIDRFIKKNHEWIDSKLKKMQHIPKVTGRQYVDGEQFYYRGKTYTLKTGNYTEIKLHGEHLLFPRALIFRAKKELTDWYIKKARELITERVNENAKAMGVTYVSLSFSDTSSKWGSCTHDNRLQFNWRLVMAPLLVLNYVTVHELAHTVEKNHSRSFWNTVQKMNPSYRQQRKWLKEHGHILVI